MRRKTSRFLTLVVMAGNVTGSQSSWLKVGLIESRLAALLVATFDRIGGLSPTY
jgi:hypothetical protein